MWVHNFEEEFEAFLEALKKYRACAIDTEFPGCIHDGSGKGNSPAEIAYEKCHQNVNDTKLIQLGFALADEAGIPNENLCWQFHFQFDVNNDVIDPGAKDLLTKAGVDWERQRIEGIPQDLFALKAEQFSFLERMEKDKILWICFHGLYDFAYLLKILRKQNIPKSL